MVVWVWPMGCGLMTSDLDYCIYILLLSPYVWHSYLISLSKFSSWFIKILFCHIFLIH